MSEHTLDLKDVSRTWKWRLVDGKKVYVTICSCGQQLQGDSLGDWADAFSHHLEDVKR